MRKKCAYLFCTLFNNFVFVACTSIWLDREKKKARERDGAGLATKMKTKTQGYKQVAALYAFRHVEATSKRVIILKLCKAALNASIVVPEMTMVKGKERRVKKRESERDRERGERARVTREHRQCQGCMWHLRNLATVRYKLIRNMFNIYKSVSWFRIYVLQYYINIQINSDNFEFVFYWRRTTLGY